LKIIPVCPVRGTYTIGTLSERPICSEENHVLP
jgi:hypothetical protein